MRFSGRHSRPKQRRRPVRYAGERRAKRSQAPRRPRVRLPRPSFSRDDLLGLYVLIFLGPLFLIAVGCVAIFAHDVAIPSLFRFAVDSISHGLLEMCRRPTLVLAFLLVLSIAWCLWGGTTASNPTHVRRGRSVRDLKEAQRLAREHQKRRQSQSGRVR